MINYLTIENFNNWKPYSINNPNVSCIYLIKIQDKEYVGLTKDLFKRIKYHIADRNKRDHLPLYNKMKSCPLNEQKVFILHMDDDLENLKKLEKEEISNRNTLFPNGLNRNTGGG